MDMIPHADHLPEWVHRLANHGMTVEGRPESGVVVFEGGDPALHVRPRRGRGSAGEEMLEALGILALLPVDHLAVAQPVRLRTPGERGAAQDLSAGAGMLLTVGRRRRRGGIAMASTMTSFERGDDGLPCWDDPVDLTGRGPLEDVVGRVLTTDPVPRRARAGVVYAADRFGHGVAVRADWRSRYGFDVALRASMVRDEDRERAMADVAEVVA